MTELLVGTKKGLFALAGEPGGDFAVTEHDRRSRRVRGMQVHPGGAVRRLELQRHRGILEGPSRA